MKTINYPEFSEQLFQETLPNGLRVFLHPMAGFNRTSAVLSVNYGSADSKFVRDGKLITQPAGIAHFLEHKMFDKKDYDVFELFNKNGGRSNAYTSFTKTNYVFSSTDNAKENLELLLNFVMQPYFDKQKVEREKGIISQEINMYKNDPDNQLFTSSVQSMYKGTSLADDIAGTDESLAKITVEDLNLAYDTFYRPDNMTLIVSGNLDPEKLMTVIRENQAQYPKRDRNVKFVAPKPDDVEGRTEIITMDVSRPKAAFTLRSNLGKQLSGDEGLRHELGLNLLMNLFFSENSSQYDELYHQGIIDDSFSFEIEVERGFQFAMLAGDTDDPAQFVSSLKGIADSIPELLDAKAEEFELQKRELLGNYVAMMDSPEAVSNQFYGFDDKPQTIYDEIEIISKLTLDDIKIISNNFLANYTPGCVTVQKKV